jgi:FkbM family methyltransferase
MKIFFDSGFEYLKNRQFVLYGASVGGETVFNYLDSLGLAGNVTRFADGDPAKHGKEFLGKKIEPPVFLKNNPGLSVIISSQFFREIYKTPRGLGCSNEFFTSPHFIRPHVFYRGPREGMPEGRPGAPMEYTLSLYDPADDYTDTYIRSLYFAKTSPDYNAIQPIEKIMDVLPIEKYWYDEATALPGDADLTMCDAGAYDGDTLREWADVYGKRIKKYYAFEPDLKNIPKLRAAISGLGFDGRSAVYSAGLGDKNATLRFSGEGMGAKFSDEGETSAETVRLDDLDIKVTGRLCVKMDIEGFELEALRGAAGTIKKYKPEMAICLYHKIDDFYMIPEYIRSLVPDCKFVIRGGAHAVCYARVC